MTSVLVVCTGNICRSPIAAALLARRLAELDVVADVSSAGLVTEDEPAHEHSIDVMVSRGLDLAPHRSRRITSAMVNESDLVLGMERAHVREAVTIAPAAWPRTFTVKEIVRRSRLVGPRPSDQPLREWLFALHGGRETAMLLGSDPNDDVADPLGQPRAAFEQTAAELGDLIDELVVYAWPRVS